MLTVTPCVAPKTVFALEDKDLLLALVLFFLSLFERGLDPLEQKPSRANTKNGLRYIVLAVTLQCRPLQAFNDSKHDHVYM